MKLFPLLGSKLKVNKNKYRKLQNLQNILFAINCNLPHYSSIPNLDEAYDDDDIISNWWNLASFETSKLWLEMKLFPLLGSKLKVNENKYRKLQNLQKILLAINFNLPHYSSIPNLDEAYADDDVILNWWNLASFDTSKLRLDTKLFHIMDQT